jgi:hypothetical protein
MNIKKSYNIDDVVWVYGISRTNNKLTQGKIIHSFTLEHAGYNNEVHYVISIPNEIEPLLEVRTWHNISQDSKGPVGTFREVIAEINSDSVDKKLSQLGLTIDSDSSYEDDEQDPTPEQIHAALEKSQRDSEHTPLLIKETKPKRRNFVRKKKA